MMRLFYKRHKWQGRNTWLGIELEEPEKERLVREGRFLIKIGEEEYPKAGFKLSPDEARALRDAVNEGLRIHDKKLRRLMNEPKETAWEHDEEPATSFGEFMESKPPEEEKISEEFKLFKPQKPKEETEVYY